MPWYTTKYLGLNLVVMVWGRWKGVKVLHTIAREVYYLFIQKTFCYCLVVSLLIWTSYSREPQKQKKIQTLVHSFIHSVVTHQRSRIRGHASEVTHQRSRIRDTHQRSRIRGHASEVTHQRSRIRGHSSEVTHQRSRIRGHASEVTHQRSRI